MDAHERGWEILFHLLHREEGDEGLGLAFKVDLQILAHTLDIADVGNGYLDNFVVGLDEDGVIFFGIRLGHLGYRNSNRRGLQSFLEAIGCTTEIIEAEGLEQIVDGIHLEALNGILGVSCGEDDEGRGCKRLDEVHAVKVGHVDVAEDGIHRFAIQELFGLEGTLALAYELEKRNFLYVTDELLERQGLVVDG